MNNEERAAAIAHLERMLYLTNVLAEIERNEEKAAKRPKARMFQSRIDPALRGTIS